MMDTYDAPGLWEDVLDVDDRPRCELDREDGGVCLTVLRDDGSCPRHPASPPPGITRAA